jgi:hypothetical protein
MATLKSNANVIVRCGGVELMNPTRMCGWWWLNVIQRECYCRQEGTHIEPLYSSSFRIMQIPMQKNIDVI